MSYDATNKIWIITMDLTAGQIKFRANHAWDINYGDNNADGTLELNGADIVVGVAGNYTIILNLNNPVYTYLLIKN